MSLIKETEEEKNNSLVVFIKWLFKKILLIVLIILILFGLFFLYLKIDKTIKTKEKDKISVSVDIGKNTKCKDLNYPVQLKITNKSSKTIIRTNINLGLRKKGFSHNFADSKFSKFNTDKIIKPSEEYIICTHSPIDGYYLILDVDDKLVEVNKYNPNNLVFNKDYELFIDYKYFNFK